VKGHPTPQPHPDRGDLVFETGPLVGAIDPDPDAILAPFAAHIEGRERADDPGFKAGHIDSHIRAAPFEIEHHIDDALAGAVIGELAAAACRKQRETGL
jgi:hypothetical protein